MNRDFLEMIKTRHSTRSFKPDRILAVGTVAGGEIVRDIDSLEQCVMTGDSESIISVASAIVDLVGERNRQIRY